ncbi:branched-chain alpha-ketoacid dehydrogenase [Melampsora americana]|nr:branched-chain alpha-ketoacid dehydrogenase [Melampsora americana]
MVIRNSSIFSRSRFTTSSIPIYSPIHLSTSLAPERNHFRSHLATEASSSLNKVTLERLMRFGSPPLSPEASIQSGELTRVELIQRLERRVKVQLSLPYLPASNPYTSEVMSIYTDALNGLRELLPITSIKDNTKFVNKLEKMIEDEANVIPLFAKGFQECKRYLSEDQIGSFLDKAIRARLSIRLLAEQHISLSKGSESSKIGIIDTQLKIRESIDRSARFVSDLCHGTYGTSPDWILQGDLNAKACFVGIHLEYVLTEILKNAFRATVERQLQLKEPSNLPPVEITTSVYEPTPVQPHPAELIPSNKSSNDLLCIRIRDYGGGIRPSDFEKIFSYAFTTVGQHEPEAVEWDDGFFGQIDGLKSGLGRIAGLGYGYVELLGSS